MECVELVDEVDSNAVFFVCVWVGRGRGIKRSWMACLEILCSEFSGTMLDRLTAEEGELVLLLPYICCCHYCSDR